MPLTCADPVFDHSRGRPCPSCVRAHGGTGRSKRFCRTACSPVSSGQIVPGADRSHAGKPAVDPVLAPACLDRRGQAALAVPRPRSLDQAAGREAIVAWIADLVPRGCLLWPGCGRFFQMPGSEICSGWAWVRFLWFASPGYPAMRFSLVKVSVPPFGSASMRAARSRAAPRVSQSARWGWLPGASAVTVPERGQPVAFGARVDVAGQPKRVDQGAGVNAGAAAVQEPPVDADVVPDDDFPFQPCCEFGVNAGEAGRCGEDVAGEAGGDPGPAGDWPARVDDGGVGAGHGRVPAGDGDEGDFKDVLVVAVLSAAAF